MPFKARTAQGVSGLFARFDYSSSQPFEPFTIYAYDTGVELMGNSPRFKTQEALEEFAKALSTAWQKHLELKSASSESGAV